MYCPNCGSQNQLEIKFCTRCGTNLGAVSVALGERPPDSVPVDDRLVKVIKEYYRGRRETITGLILIPAAVKAIWLLILFGLNPLPAFFICSWMMFWGIGALASGLGKWNSSSGEMRALGYKPPASRLWTRVQRLFSPETGQSTVTTNSLMELPGSSPSVTEHTTRQLDERRDRPPLELPDKNR